ncbi:MAG: Dabb family protein [Clostridia bacterium]
MVKHVVLYKLIDSSAAGRKAVTERLMSMKGKIDILKNIEAGQDFLSSDRSYDVCLICTFNTREDLTTYAQHPVHLPVKAFMKTAVDKAVSCDFDC